MIWYPSLLPYFQSSILSVTLDKRSLSRAAVCFHLERPLMFPLLRSPGCSSTFWTVSRLNPIGKPDSSDIDKYFTPQGEPVVPFVGSMNVASSPDPEPPPSVLLSRLHVFQEEVFVAMWGRLPQHLRKYFFHLVGPEFTTEVVRRMIDALINCESRFSKSRTNLGH